MVGHCVATNSAVGSGRGYFLDEKDKCRVGLALLFCQLHTMEIVMVTVCGPFGGYYGKVSGRWRLV